LLAVVSPGYLKSKWCKREWQRFIEKCGGETRETVNRHGNGTPDRHSKGSPFRSAGKLGDGQPRFLKRQDSLPVSMISQ
jgi:hypothetical protein